MPSCWRELIDHYPRVELDAFIVMQTMFTGVLFLTDIDYPVGADLVRAGFKLAP
ncbi:MAG: hypothetical protein PHE50_00800 [Dehalococcoidales bacterium]|nr:hypothetical protein [Dehalococcoidales bacterium]